VRRRSRKFEGAGGELVKGLGIVLWFIFFCTIPSLRAEFDFSVDDDEEEGWSPWLWSVCGFFRQ
jgi:hypothetical protein